MSKKARLMLPIILIVIFVFGLLAIFAVRLNLIPYDPTCATTNLNRQEQEIILKAFGLPAMEYFSVTRLEFVMNGMDPQVTAEVEFPKEKLNEVMALKLPYEKQSKSYYFSSFLSSQHNRQNMSNITEEDFLAEYSGLAEKNKNWVSLYFIKPRQEAENAVLYLDSLDNALDDSFAQYCSLKQRQEKFGLPISEKKLARLNNELKQ